MSPTTKQPVRASGAGGGTDRVRLLPLVLPDSLGSDGTMSERPSADFRLPISLIEDWKVLSEMAEGEFRGRCIQALCHLAAAELLEDQVLG